MIKKSWLRSRAINLLAISVLVAPIVAGCGSGSDQRSGANMPPVDESSGRAAQTMDYGAPPQQPKHGLSTGQKVAILAGAAALYYMYKKNKAKHEQGDANAPQYYLSKNGRVYYRDASGRAHWVTPPQQGIQVPADEAAQYRDMQGYNGNQGGRSLLDMVGSSGYETGNGY